MMEVLFAVPLPLNVTVTAYDAVPGAMLTLTECAPFPVFAPVPFIQNVDPLIGSCDTVAVSVAAVIVQFCGIGEGKVSVAV